MCEIPKEEEIDYYNNSDYSKSNFLISSKYKSSLLENKIMAITLSRIQDAYEDPAGGLIVTIKGSELKKMLKTKSGSFYEQLELTASKMTGRTIGMSNPEKEEFYYMSVVTNAYYRNGEFSIEYNKSLNKYLKELKQNFTRLNLMTMLNFSSGYSFRIYELIKSKMYMPKGVVNKDNKYKISFGLAEFKFEIGVINAELSSVKAILNNSKFPDYIKASKVSEEKMLDNWAELRRRAIDVAIKEINEKTELEVDYDTERTGKGGKVVGITFYVKAKDNAIQEEDEEIVEREYSSEEKENIIASILKLIKEEIRIRDARIIAEAASYDLELIKKKYELSKTKEIKNITGWMIKAIKEDFNEASASKKRELVKNKFNDFEQRDYDFDQLEMNL